MNYNQAINYLYSLGNEVTAMKLGLENPRRLLAALGNPHRRYLKVQVAGTNGKGSTCAFLDSICGSAGIKTGLYTSPHLVSITERIKIEGRDISEQDFARLATKVRNVTEAERLQATFFEQVTAIALLAFAEKAVELAILETGLGGRLDATTAAESEIVAIMPVDYDHQQYLGETLAEIAAEKAAIIRPATIAVVARQHAEAEQVILGRCREVGVEPIRATTDVKTKIYNEGGYQIISRTFTTRKMTYPYIDLSLAGEHQSVNAAMAISLAEVLQELNFRITDFDICMGLETAVHPGRLEFRQGILLDGAHNIAGAKALRDYLREFVSQPVTLIFGAMKDKQITEIAEILFPLAARLILTKPVNDRAAEPADLARLTDSPATLTDNVEQALAEAENFPENLTCVTGSLYLVGEARKILDGK
jgi:dihydrofolate synthase/folylpolyglutamate synthase